MSVGKLTPVDIQDAKTEILNYYFPDGKLNKDALRVLHDGNNQNSSDMQTARDLLKNPDVELTDAERKQLKRIAFSSVFSRVRAGIEDRMSA
ncbi:MAG: hypothetical protein K9L85_03105 [Candidatus Peribacteraceae bacterium]|nr:hypothetical protein [Candidatus Peribacteraceae bacterium]